MRQSGPKKQCRSNRKGYSDKHDFETFEEILIETSDFVKAYMQHDSKKNYATMIVMQSYMDWAPGGARFKPFEEVEESGQFEEWVMSLVKVKTDTLTDLVRPTKETMLPWVSVRKSNIPNSGLGLFAEKTFKRGDIITVFCGRVFRGNKRDDTLVSFRRSNGTVVYLDTRP